MAVIRVDYVTLETVREIVRYPGSRGLQEPKLWFIYVHKSKENLHALISGKRRDDLLDDMGFTFVEQFLAPARRGKPKLSVVE